MKTLAPLIATELSLPERKVAAAVALLADKNTIPFISRYRKEVTGGLDEVQLRAISERLEYLSELTKRRAAVLASIEEQGALTPELAAAIAACRTKAELEDLYLPYKKKRRTRGQMARERGLEPLAERIRAQPREGDPAVEARAFIGDDVPDAAAALAGARDIVAEIMAETAQIRAVFRQRYETDGVIVSKAARGKKKERSKFEQYYDFREPVARLPSHRYLAIRRGENEGFLKARIEVDENRAIEFLERTMGVDRRSPFAGELAAAIADGFTRLLGPSIESEVRANLKQRSDGAAVDVFAENLGNLLMAAPLGGVGVVGIDPGLRTGCKCVALDATGKFLANTTIYMTGKAELRERAGKDLAAFIKRHSPGAVAVGNGTGGREAEALVRELQKSKAIGECIVVSVNEAGASVYSASEIAREEFPELDVTVRGAISIARRLQDPLAELVKVEPKAIGVGQYQHDVHQPLLVRKLGDVVESCVNRVGVDLNTASFALLAYVAGIGRSLAKKIVEHRDRRGAFRSRRELLKVSGLGPRAFEQAAGFLRIRNGAHPLDASAVHPERYELIERVAGVLGVDVAALVGNKSLAGRVDISAYVGDGVGEPTMRDIVAELERPGRDPRASFTAPSFRDDVNELADLEIGMVLEGVVTNVTAFGAFVDVGVHQDGLVHISKLADRFVKDPNDVVKVGDKLRVTVLEVDLERKRISLSAKSESVKRGKPPAKQAAKKAAKKPAKKKPETGSFANNPFSKLRSD